MIVLFYKMECHRKLRVHSLLLGRQPLPLMPGKLGSDFVYEKQR